MSSKMEDWHFPARYDQHYLPDPSSPYWFPHRETMDPQERKKTEEQVGMYQAVLLAMERRHDVMEAVWAASDAEDARRRLRDQLGVDETGAHAILDLQIHHLTALGRQRITGHMQELLAAQLGTDGTSPT